MKFNALIVNKDESGAISTSVQEVGYDQLPEGDVTVAVEYSGLNYKDGLCLGPGGGGLVRTYPHVAGVDIAGVVEASSCDKFSPGDRVLSTGWRVGENRWGGYAQKARLKSEWLVRLPDGLDSRRAMAIGTAGLSAMLGIRTLEKAGLAKDRGPVLVTGASGGVGSVAVAALAKFGYEVAAVTGRPENADYLQGLGATQIIPRDDLSETVKRPLESETWNGCVDAVGGTMLARILGQMKYGTQVAAIGLAGGASMPASVIPFLLRAISLIGIDSTMHPVAERERAWTALAQLLPHDLLDRMATSARLEDVPELGAMILAGKVRGRVVVDVNG